MQVMIYFNNERHNILFYIHFQKAKLVSTETLPTLILNDTSSVEPSYHL